MCIDIIGAASSQLKPYWVLYFIIIIIIIIYYCRCGTAPDNTVC